MSVIVNSNGQEFTVTRGTAWRVSQFSLNVIDDEGETVASFREWSDVHPSPSDETVSSEAADGLTITIPWPSGRGLIAQPDRYIVRVFKEAAAEAAEREAWKRLTQKPATRP